MQFTSADYALLLGFYLGDGHITQMARSQRLRVGLDAKYPKVIEELTSLLKRCFPANRVGCHHQHGGTMAVVWLYSKHLGCLFPQHGPGLKHSRLIELEDWQRLHVESEPWALIKGLIWTDGCAFINRTGPYEYLSYDFSNTSTGIVELFLDACSAVGVAYRANFNEARGFWDVRINRRESVALMREHVGLKR